MPRSFPIAALTTTLAAAIAALAASAAVAQSIPNAVTVADPQGRFSVSAPKDWPTDFETSPNGRTAVLVGVDPECQFHAIPDPNSTSIGADAVRRAWTAPIGDAKWAESLNPFRGVIWGSATATLVVTDQTVDTESAYFPTQKAVATGNGKTATVGIHPRPGMVVYSFCRVWDAKNEAPIAAGVQASLKTPQDEALAAAGAAAEAERAAKQAAAVSAPAPAAAQPAAATPPAEPARRSTSTRGIRR